MKTFQERIDQVREDLLIRASQHDDLCDYATEWIARLLMRKDIQQAEIARSHEIDCHMVDVRRELESKLIQEENATLEMQDCRDELREAGARQQEEIIRLTGELEEIKESLRNITSVAITYPEACQQVAMLRKGIQDIL